MKNPWRSIKSKDLRWSRSGIADAIVSPQPTATSSQAILPCALTPCLFFCLSCHSLSLLEIVYKLTGLLAWALCIKVLLCGHFQCSCVLEVARVALPMPCFLWCPHGGVGRLSVLGGTLWWKALHAQASGLANVFMWLLAKECMRFWVKCMCWHILGGRRRKTKPETSIPVGHAWASSRNVSSLIWKHYIIFGIWLNKKTLWNCNN